MRARVVAVFAGGACLLAASLAPTTYENTRHNLLAERERTSIRAAYFDAAVVRQGLASDDADVVGVLRVLDTGQGRRPLLRRDDQWFAPNGDDGITAASPRPSPPASPPWCFECIMRCSGSRWLVILHWPVGLPVPGIGTDFYEVQSLSEIQARDCCTSA